MVHAVVAAFRALVGEGPEPLPSEPLAAALIAHRLAPYAYSRFSAAWQPLLRPALAETFAAAHVRAPLLAHALAAIAAQGDIAVVALKGLDYAQSLYGDVALRPMGDHDLLVKQRDYPRAHAALLAAGFKDALVQTGVAAHPQHYAAQLICEGYGLDLHRAVRQSVRAEVDYEAVFAQATPRADGVLIPAPQHRVLLHCLHMAGHEFCGPLLSFLDLELMESDDETRKLAKKWRVEHAFVAALRLRARLLGQRVPRVFLGDSLLPSIARLSDPSEAQSRALQLARKLVLLDDWEHRLAFGRYAALLAIANR